VVEVASAAATEIDITLPKSDNILSHKQPLTKSTNYQIIKLNISVHLIYTKRMKMITIISFKQTLENKNS